MKVLIIEDEVVAADALRSLLGEVCPEAEVLAILQSIDESVEWFTHNPMPDVAFMDIHLADGSSFAIFEETQITCPVIFTTAYDEYALKAFEVNSIDYLLKPISAKDLGRAVGKYRNMAVGGASEAENKALMTKLLSSLGRSQKIHRSYFLVHERDKLIPMAADDVAYIRIDGREVKATTLSGCTHILELTLEEIMQELDPEKFFRANRQYIVAHQVIADMSIWFGGKLSLNLKIAVPEKVLISKARTAEFKEWFAGRQRHLPTS